MQSTLTVLQTCTASATPCEWPQFLALLNELTRFAIYLAVIFATLTIAYGGFKMLVSAGNSSEISAAKSMITNAVLGIIITMIAWLVVQYILTSLGLNPNYSLLK